MLSNSDIENYKKIVAQFNRAQADEQAMQAQSAQTSNQLAMAQKYGADASLAMQQLEKVGGGSMY